MKLKMFSLIALMVLGTVSLSVAEENAIPTKSNNTLNVVAQLVKKQFAYPEFAKAEKIQNGMVIIEFMVSEDGSIEVIATNQSDLRFKDYVMTELEKINVKEIYPSSNQVYQLKLDFKLL